MDIEELKFKLEIKKLADAETEKGLPPITHRRLYRESIPYSTIVARTIRAIAKQRTPQPL